MMKMLIKLDEERVLRDGKYDLAGMWRAIDGQFERYNCIREAQPGGGVLYSGDPDQDYFTCMGLSYLFLRKQQWFAQYCSQWIMYDNDDDEELPFQHIDLLAKERGKNPLFLSLD